MAGMEYPAWMYLGSVIWVGLLAVYDVLHKRVTNWITIPPLIIMVFVNLFTGHYGNIVVMVIIFAAMGITFFKGGTGGADVKVYTTLSGIHPFAAMGGFVGVIIFGTIDILRGKGKEKIAGLPPFALGYGAVVLILVVISWVTK